MSITDSCSCTLISPCLYHSTRNQLIYLLPGCFTIINSLPPAYSLLYIIINIITSMSYHYYCITVVPLCVCKWRIKDHTYLLTYLLLLLLHCILGSHVFRVLFSIAADGARWCRGMFGALQPEGCRFESTSSRPRRDLEQVLRAQLLCNIIASVPPRRVALLSLGQPLEEGRYQRSVVLYCIFAL